ncbi:uncharacterized protein [Rutidosis leptorrhynchoides]|uniref:uncharacterized protein n=1 Tax=Rutidosis leptorrhynchoides TaxID=125765 RepID=UPI003A99E51B
MKIGGHGHWMRDIITLLNPREFIWTEGCYLCTNWYKFLPRIIKVFLWRLKLDSLPLRWNLSAKGLDINSTPYCLSGLQQGVASRDHLFFGCSLALDVWRNIRIWVDRSLPSFASWEDFVSWIVDSYIPGITKDRIIAIVVTLFWAGARIEEQNESEEEGGYAM